MSMTRAINDDQLDRLRRAPVIPNKLLLGPGPTNLPPSVHDALGTWSTLGHMHPEFLQVRACVHVDVHVQVMDDVRVGLQYVFRTDNRLTFAISGTGHAGMEAAMVNIIEPGTRVVVCQNGIWGVRAAHLARVMGGDVHVISVPVGQAFTLASIEQVCMCVHVLTHSHHY
jgi:alanine-glyoxylate transaminase/serine-glyoxylate transaminase/serine-pyruvate transaminase